MTVSFATKRRGARVAQHDASARHALADVVVGIAFQVQVQAARVPDTEALAGIAAAAHADGRRVHAVVAPAPRDLPREPRADGAVEVLQLVAPFAAGLRRDRRQHVAHHALGELALVEGRVGGRDAELRRVAAQPGLREDRRQVELALLGRHARQHGEVLGAADDLAEAAHPEGCQDLAHFLGDEAEVVHHHLRQAGEVLRAQHVVLRGDAGRAVVEVADAQVLAPERHHRRGAEPEALRPDDRRLHHVESGLEPAVGLQSHAVAQVVAAQRLVRLRQPELPGRARVLDRGQGARAGAAVVAGDGDEVGVRLGDAGGHRADAGLGHQLHRHQRRRIHLLQVEDQLRQILDGVDVVMRRRGDEARRPGARSAGSRSCR